MLQLGNQYRSYALDFWGFGESGKRRTSFAVTDFSKLVVDFMDSLGIAHAPLVGHSMGGTVSLLTAIKYPERISKVAVIGSPIVGDSLAFLLKLAGCRPIAVLAHNLMWALKFGIRIAAPWVTRDKSWPEMFSKDLSHTTLDSFLQSIASLYQTDLRTSLKRINIPVMGMYGYHDVIVDPDQWIPLSAGIPHAQIRRFKHAGHFIMLDEKDKYLEMLKIFLDLPGIPSFYATQWPQSYRLKYAEDHFARLPLHSSL
jgi:pimeloyl-ACP methyl ester carboxylesterase